MQRNIETYALQIILGLIATVSFTLGLSGIWMGPNNMNEVVVPNRLDNHYRYLSGLVMGFALTIWFYVIPRISQATIIFRIFVFMVFMGGIARLVGIFKLGIIPDLFTLTATIVELVFAPMLCVWQARIAERKNQ